MLNCVRLQAVARGTQSFKPSFFLAFKTFTNSFSYFFGEVYAFFFTGPFVIYIAGYIHSFTVMSFDIILDDHHPTIRLIFQNGENVIPNFEIGSFLFELLQALIDSCVYRVRSGDFDTKVIFYGIDAETLYNYRSNVDFVHFVWEHFERFPLRKFAITILPRDNAPTPFRLEGTRLLYLKHYRAISDGCWKDRGNCVECVYNFHISLQNLSALIPLLLFSSNFYTSFPILLISFPISSFS